MTIKALQIRNGQAVGAVDLYRDGDVVTMVAHGEAERDTPYGKVRTRGALVHQYDSVEAYEYERNRLFNRFPLAYARLVGRLGVDDDARRAPPLPDDLRHLLPEHARVLEQSTATSGRPREAPGRPFLALAAASRRGG